MASAYLGTLWTQPSTARLDQPAQHTSIEFIDLHYRAESSKPRRYYAQVGGDIEIAVWRGLYVLGEYKFTGTDARISVDGGAAVIPARSHHVVGGMAVRF